MWKRSVWGQFFNQENVNIERNIASALKACAQISNFDNQQLCLSQMIGNKLF